MLHAFNTNPNINDRALKPVVVNGCLNREPPEASGVCVILGAHPCWEADLIELGKVHKEFDVCGVNYASTLVECEHIATCHDDLVDKIIEEYQTRHDTDKTPLIHTRNRKKINNDKPWYVWDIQTVSSSAPFAAAAMAQIYDLVVMCGCPITGTGGYAVEGFEATLAWTGKKECLARSRQNYMRKFCKQYPEIADKIRSMSGATQEIYGGL